MSRRRDASGSGRSTAESKSTARPSVRPFQWALHWVFPHAEVIPLSEGECKIGRDPGCGSVLADSEVSREHALLSVEGLSCRVVDLRSRNGISVNGARVSEAALHDGSVLRLGGTLGVIVHSPDAVVGFSALLRRGEISYWGSGKLKRSIAQAREVGALSDPVHVHGESGTGKEAIAELLHEASARSGPLVPVNCSALRGELATSAIFGHVKGAFSGAIENSEGAARAAQRGTLFLDEIGELASETQPLLLRLLQNGQITPVGRSRAERVDVRVVSASHEDLFALCREKRFREDLYFRLTTHELRLPALRERREDILGLFQLFAERSLQSLSAGFVEALLQLTLRGNVRELQNLAARLKISARSDALWHAHLLGGAAVSVEPTTSAEPAALDWTLLHQQYGGVATRIARATGIPVTTVKRHLTKSGLRG